MTRDALKTGIQKAVKLEAVPQERFSQMLQRTVLGLLFVGLGLYLVVGAEGMKLYVGVGLVIVGATTWSGQVVTGALKALADPFKAFREASRGD